MFILQTRWQYTAALSMMLLLGGCGQRDTESSYAGDYLAAVAHTSATAVTDETVETFAEVFNHLQSDALAGMIDAVYADSFFFNDTFRTVTNKAELTVYLQETGQSIERLTVNIADIAHSENDVYIRWTMTMQFTVMGRPVENQSIGMSHLRYDTNDKIILQQDYWDGVDAFYQHIPVIGFWLDKIRERL